MYQNENDNQKYHRRVCLQHACSLSSTYITTCNRPFLIYLYKFILVSEAWENTTKEMYYSFLSLAAKYEFKYIEIGLTFLVKAVDNASQWQRGRKSIDGFFDDNENADGVRLRTHQCGQSLCDNSSNMFVVVVLKFYFFLSFQLHPRNEKAKPIPQIV